MSFQVKEGIGVPPRIRNRLGSTYEVLLEMEDGQCFDVPVAAEAGHTNRKGEEIDPRGWQSRTAHARQSYIAGYAKRNGIKVITRWMQNGDEYSDGEAIIRVWHDGMIVKAEA